MDRKYRVIAAMDEIDVSKQVLQHVENYTKKDWDQIGSIITGNWKKIDFHKIAREGGIAIYCRAAVHADQGFERQKTQLLKFANDVGIDSAVIRLYEDNGLNGLSLDRPGIQALLKDIRKNIIKTVFVDHEGVISRRLEDIYTFFDEISLYDVSIISPKYGRLHSALTDLCYLAMIKEK